MTGNIARSNRLIALLPEEVGQHLLSISELVELVSGEVMGVPWAPMPYVYFPTECYIALGLQAGSDSRLGLALVGNEGMYGIPLLLGGPVVSMWRAVVEGSGHAWRVDAGQFHGALQKSEVLQQSMNRYIQVRMHQLAQLAFCNRFHLVEQRFARLLLLTRDCAHSSEFHITHEHLAQLLGVRRVGVTKAAVGLQKQKLIHYSRGNVKILDSAGLESAACGCYREEKETYQRLIFNPAGMAG